jgi:hypothetical protein
MALPHLGDIAVWARDDVDAHNLADATGGFGACIDGGADGGDIAFERNRDQAAADLVLLDELHVRCLEGRIARFDGGDDAFGFDQSNCFTVCHDGSLIRIEN